MTVALIFIASVLIALALGALTRWVDRKVTALVQARVGPPWYQPVADVLKLLGKETLVPEQSQGMGFLAAPMLGFAGACAAAAVLIGTLLGGEGFLGDVVVLVYLLTIPAVAVIFGACASGSPVSVTGASREMKMLLAYELPLLIAILTTLLRAGAGAPDFRFETVLAFQRDHGWLLYSTAPDGAGFAVSGIIGFVVALVALQAKLGLVPFDVAEAEQELMGGVISEYAGAPLALIRLTKMMLVCLAVVFLGTLFLGGFDFSTLGAGVASVLKYVAVLVLVVLVRNTNPRLRIDQILWVFWGPVTALAVLGLVLAAWGY